MILQPAILKNLYLTQDNIKYNKQEIIDIDTLIIDMKMALNK